MKRDTGEISFNNPQELLQLLQCSSSLKTFHPELFDKYAFADNINVLCNLQLQHELPSEISQSIQDVKNHIYNRTTKAEPNRDFNSSEIEH